MADPVAPFEIGPHDCIDIEYRVVSSQNEPDVIYLMLIGPDGTTVGYIYYRFSDWLTCLNLASCDMDINSFIDLEQVLPNQTVYLKFTFDIAGAGAVDNVPALWCDQGRILESNFDGSTYSGRLMLDYGLLSQLTANGGDFCFHVIICFDGKMCIQDICIPYDALWNVVQNGESYERGNQEYRSKGGSQTSTKLQSTSAKLTLDPNPATGTVSICDATTRVPVADVVSVEVISMQGQVVLAVTGTGRLDISKLPAGSYIVKVVTGDDSCDYLKLIKK